MSRKVLRKTLGAFLIIASLVIAAIPTSDVVAAEETQSVITDFQLNGSILVKYTGTATTVSVPDAVKEIGEEAFADCSEMVTIKLPPNLKKISYAAFSGCNKLKEVIIPSSVEEIGTAAFCNCTSLEKFTLGSGVKKLGTGLFTGCPNLSTITGNERFVCEDGVIYDKDKTTVYQVLQAAKIKKAPEKDDSNSSDNKDEYVLMKQYKMPDSVTHIMPYAFYGCRNIENVILSTNLEEIPAYSFAYCNGLTSISIPYSVNNIDVKAFQYCINLENVDIPASVSFIHKTAFDGCSKLKINAPYGSYAYKWFEKFDNSSVNIIDEEDNGASGSDEKDDGAYVPEPIEGLISETVIVARQAVFFIDNSKLTVHSGPITPDSDEYEYPDVSDMEEVLKKETNGKGLSLPKFAVIDRFIAGKAYYANKDLKTADIPKKITSIGDFAYARTGLTEVTIPENVTHIGYGAFYHCDDLATILVPSTVTDIEASAFAKTRMLENWYMYGSDDYLIMGDGILVAYKGNATAIVIPEGVKQIGPEVFKNNTNITDVHLPDSVWRVCEEAFMNCSNLRSVTGGMALEVIEDRGFYGCPITTIRLVDSVRKIGAGAFNLNATYCDSANRVAVFQGNSLPLTSYSKLTSRLTNDSYRVDALEGVKVAIVNSENVNRLYSILDRTESGFSGLICVISEPNTEYFNGTLKIIDCTLNSDEAQNFSVPSTVYIYGKGYNFDTEQLSAVISMAKEGAYNPKVEATQTQLSEEDDTNEESLIKEISETITIPGNREEFVLDIVKDSYINIDVKDAYKRIYGDNVPSNLATYTIFLTEKDSNVRISKFGKQTVPIKIELPDNMPTKNLHVICIDEYSQLEDLPFTVTIEEGRFYVNFDISHTGYYGLYAFNSSAVSDYDLDESPETGDPIHPKWFLSIGLLAIGCALLLIKGRDMKLAK